MSKNRGTDEAQVCDDGELDLLIADVLSRIDGNEPVDIDQVIAGHPQYAADLRNFFSLSQELAEIMGTQVSSSVASSVVDQAQRSTTSIDSKTLSVLSGRPSGDEAAPNKIGKYGVIELLGAGSFGRVYLGYDPLANRRVAIKVPRNWVEVSQEQRTAFLHEAQSAASLRHENIVTLLDVYQGNDVPIALIYEHIPGPSMQVVLKQRDFERSEAVGWIADIAAALDYAHRKHIVHRDVKPSNILLTDSNGRLQPRVLDFGLALLHNQFWRKGDRTRVGAIPYMSPEQAKYNSHWATAQSDVFSLGVILYEVLCGRSPWTGSSNAEVLREIEERDPAPPRAMDDSISPELERICLKALAKSATERYTTAGDMARDLRAATGERTPRLPQWTKLAAAAAAAVIFMIGAFGLTPLRHGDAVPPVPTVERIEPQEVRLDLRLQPSGKPGDSIVVDDDTDHLEAGDRLQINAEIPQRGYMYVVWYRPDGTARLMDEKALSTPSLAIQEPPVDNKTPWELIGTKADGKHLVVAFTKPTPLTAEEVDRLKRARWQAETDWLGERIVFRTAHPRTRPGTSRGGFAPEPAGSAIDDDRFLDELGTLLKYDWECYYEAIMFRVN